MPDPCFDPVSDQNFVTDFELNYLPLVGRLTSALGHFNHPPPNIICLQVLDISGLNELLLKRLVRGAFDCAMIFVIVIFHALNQSRLQFVVVGLSFQLLRIFVNDQSVLDSPVEPLDLTLRLRVIRRTMQHTDTFESANILKVLISEFTSVITMKQPRVPAYHHIHFLK